MDGADEVLQWASVQVNLVGGFELLVAGMLVSAPATMQRVIAYLALNHRVSRERAAGELWPSAPPERGLQSLRNELWRIQHRACGALVVDRGGVRLGEHVRVDLDVLRCGALEVATRPQDLSADVLLSTLPDGELLPGWPDEWVVLERERARQEHLHYLEDVAAELLRRGQYSASLRAAMLATKIEPLRESSHRLVIAVHLAEGNLFDARRHYARVRRLLRTELGVEPSAALRALVPQLEARGVPPGRSVASAVG